MIVGEKLPQQQLNMAKHVDAQYLLVKFFFKKEACAFTSRQISS